MLPDFPQSRRELYKKLQLRIRLKAQAASPTDTLGAGITQHEGVYHSYDQLTASGVRTVREGFKEIKVPIEVRIDEIPELVGERLIQRVDAIAEEVARETAQIFFRKMDETIKAGGTAIDAGGGPPTKEIWLQMFRGMEMDFDPKTGKPEVVFIAHPVMAGAMQRLSTEWENDQAFMKEYKDLLARKREEWRDRESRRKLVD